MKINPNYFACKKILSVAIPMLMYGQVEALQYDSGEISVSLDTQFSIGSSWRMEKQSDNLLDYTGSGTPDSNTSNDGNLNYDEGDAFSQIFKGNHDLQIAYKNFGAFLRAKYWYDSAIENNSVNHGHGPTAIRTGDQVAAVGGFNTVDINSKKQKLDDSDFNDLSKGSGATILDAFVYGSFDIAEMPLDLRIGKQVVSWGESTFIGGGINSINPVDAAALRRPGAEIKEVLLPVNMVYANLGVTDSLSLEAFYQLEWQETVSDPCGTYFSTSDVTSDGCTNQIFNIGFDAVMHRDPTNGTVKASDDGQYGIAARYFSDYLDAEFGLYAMNIHSRLPIYSTIWNGTTPGGNNYFIEYPEDITLVGLSYAGNAAGLAISGEISHKMDVPVQINGTMVAQTALFSGNIIAADPEASAEKQLQYSNLFNSRDAVTGVIHGYRQFDVTQIQGAISHLQSQFLGASRWAFALEAGLTYVHEFDEELRYGKSSIYQAPSFNGESDKFDRGFMTETSWGYRAVAAGTYTNAFAGVDLVPVIFFSHDVDGYSPGPGGQFQEDVKKLGLILKANYLQRYDATISYNMFMGGEFNDVKDRDFLAISAGVQF